MRVLPLLVTTLLLAAPVFAQQTSSKNSVPLNATTATADTPPAHPITPEQVREIRELSHAYQLRVQVMQAMFIKARKTFPPYWPNDVADDMETSLEHIDFVPIEIKAYQKRLSTEDAAEIIAFYKTPAGQHLVGAMPGISREMMDASGIMAAQVFKEVIARHIDEIEAAEKKYKQEHSDTPTITSPN